jgi:phenylalanyl-tRNA synthetase beta chain
VGVIADDQQVESLAGIMGGDATAVSDDTKHVYVEAAFWWPQAIAGRSRRYNFSTDAGHRFERGVDPGQTVKRIERITQLIIDICGTPDTVCGPVDDVQVNMPKAAPVTLRVARAAKVIGMPLTQAQCVDALKRLGLPVVEGEGTLTVTPPGYRFDLQIEDDLIEEVVRMVGYEHLPAVPPLGPITAKIRLETERSPFAVRRALAGLGYQETINFSFVEERWEHELAGNPNPVRLLNPIASQMSVMRSSLVGSLVQALKFNLDRKATRVNIFELGRVFLRDAQSIDSDTSVAGFNQPMRVAGLAYGPRAALHWDDTDKVVDFFDVKGDMEALLAPVQASFAPVLHPALHPGRSASVSVDGQVIGFIGELHPKWRQAYELAQAPVVFELALDAVVKRRTPRFEAVSKFQPVERDIALIVPESTTHAGLMAAIEGADTKGLLKEARLFDVYRPQQGSTAMQSGEKSLAVRLVLSSAAATLTDEQIDAAVQAVIANLQTALHARLRA